MAPVDKPVELDDRDIELVGSFAEAERTFDALAAGPLAEIANWMPSKPEVCREYVRRAVKYLGLLLSGAKQIEAQKKAGLMWSEVFIFTQRSPWFGQMYEMAKRSRAEAREAAIYDAAMQAITEGLPEYDEEGKLLGNRISVQVLCALIRNEGSKMMSARHRQATMEDHASARAARSGLSFNFGGKKSSMGVIDVV